MVSREARRRIYLRCGMRVETSFVYPRCYFHTANIRLGVDVLVNHGAHIENVAPVEIGDHTALGVFVTVLTSSHRIGPHRERCGPWRQAPVSIGDGCWIGAHAVILPGVTIGDGSVVAAGAVVRDDCEPDGLYAGVPARRVRELSHE
jgi:maltose O-acetyltransferase